MTARVEDLLAESSWLEGLARALVGDREEARELVQEVWVRTLEEHPAGVRRPRAWLAQVLRNALGMRRRAQGARRARERMVARPEAITGSDEVVARAESLRLLVGVVLALDEPLRSTVLWRYFDGLSSAAIARRQGVPESTVRNRLVQALAELRVRLGNSRSDWRASLGLIVCAEAARNASLTSGVALAATLAVCGVGGTWWALRPSTQEPAAVPLVFSAASPASVDPTPNELLSAREPLVERAAVSSGAATSPTTPSSEGSRSTPPLSPGVFEVEVLDDGEPCAHAGFFELAPDWFPWMSDEEPEARQRLTAVRPGCARAENLAPGNYGVRFVSTAHSPLSSNAMLVAEAGTRVVLLGGTSSIHGTVWDDSGLPMIGAVVVMSRRSGDSPAVSPLAFVAETSLRTRTGEDGTYSFAGLAGGMYAPSLATPEEIDLEHFSLTLDPGTTLQRDFGRPSALPVWTGALVARSGEPCAGPATLRLFQGDELLRLRTSGSDGRFALALEPGTYDVRVQLNLFDSPEVHFGQIELTERGLQQDLVLPGTRLAGQVRLASGAPPPAELELRLAAHPLGHDYPAARHHAQLDSDGRYTIDALEPGVYELWAEPLVLTTPLRIEVFTDDVARALDVILRDP